VYQLPDRFLCGSPEAPYKWRRDVPLSRKLSSEEWVSFEYFKWRAAEFLMNIDDLKLPSVLNGSTLRHHVFGERVNKGRFTSNAWPGRHRAKGLFLDFRPLILCKRNDQRSNFGRAKNIVNRSTDDKPLREFVKSISDSFLTETTELSVDSRLSEEDRTHSVKALLDLWFNTYYFHSGTSEQSRRAGEIQTIFEREGIEQLLFFELIQAAHYVRCLYAVIERTKPGTPFYSCPDQRLVEH
jgi:hypothetical protein